METNTELQELFIPPKWRKIFEFGELTEKKEEWNLILRERKDLIPKELEGKEVSLNGFMNPVEVADYPFREKKMYIKFYRRQWKEKEGTKICSNTYELHPLGMKATEEFGNFLKGLTGEERDEFFRAWPDIRYIRKEDL